MTIAFIYKWTEISTGKWYIGSRTKQGCNPDDGYLCSSKIVKPKILENKENWAREVLCIGVPAYILELETKYLTILDAKIDPMSYNMHNGDGKFTTAGITMSKEWKDGIRKGNVGKIRDDVARENYRRANQTKAADPEYIEKLKKPKPLGHGANVSAATKGVVKSEEHRKAMSDAKKGKKTGPCSDERRNAIREALKGKHTLPLITCPHCGLEGRSNMKRWHFDNCKKRK